MTQTSTDNLLSKPPGNPAGRPVKPAKVFLFFLIPWLLMVAAVAASDWRQLPAGAGMGSAFVVAGLAAWRWLGPSRRVLYLLAFLVALSLFHIWYVVGVHIELAGDEALFWDCSRKPDWCYVTKGPGAPLCILAARLLLGSTELGVRAPAIIFSFASSLVILQLGKRLYDEKVGVLSATLLQVTPLFAFNAVGMTTDPPLVFFWLLAMLLMHRAWKEPTPWVWLLLGLTVGLGVQAKYTMILFALPAFLLLVFSPARRQLLTPWPYLAAVVCLATIVPLYIWNREHNWWNFHHNFGQTRLEHGAQASLASLGLFAGSQLGMVTPLLLVMLIWASVKLRRQDPFCFWFTVPLTLFFLAKSFQGNVQPNWAQASYLAGLVSFSAYFLARRGQLGVHTRRLTDAAVVVAVIGTILLHVVCVMPFPHNMDPLEKVRRGSPRLGQEVARLSAELGPRQFIVSNDYMTTSSLAFYVPGQPDAYCYCLSPTERRINEYDAWPGFEGKLGYDAIVVIRGVKRELPARLQNSFASCEKRMVTVTSSVGGIETTYCVFLCRGFKGIERVFPTKYN